MTEQRSPIWYLSRRYINKQKTNDMATDRTVSKHQRAYPSCFFQRHPSFLVWYLLALLHAAVQVPNSSIKVFWNKKFLALRKEFVLRTSPLFGQLPQSHFQTADGFCLALFENQAQRSWPRMVPSTTTNKLRVRTSFSYVWAIRFGQGHELAGFA